MDRSPEAAVSIGPLVDIYSEYKAYEITFQIEDNEILNGETCTDYTKMEGDYNECVVTHFKEQLKSVYGCNNMPPWMNTTCDDIVKENINLDPVDLDKAWADIDKLTDGLTIESMHNCKPPCKR